MAREAHTRYQTVTRTHKFKFAGCCIYCGADGSSHDLTLEHIIPEAIGGRLSIPKASCEECRDETHAFEGHVISKLYGDARAHLKMSRGKKRPWPTAFKSRVVKEGKIQVQVNPLETHPGWLFGIELSPAGIFYKQQPPPDERPLLLNIQPRLVNPEFIDHWRKTKDTLAYPAGGLQISAFYRFLAKIGHSYAVAQFGIGTFIPFLTGAIRNQNSRALTQYVGSQLSPYKPDGIVGLHDISQVAAYC